MGKSREELLAMATVPGEVKNGNEPVPLDNCLFLKNCGYKHIRWLHLSNKNICYISYYYSHICSLWPLILYSGQSSNALIFFWNWNLCMHVCWKCTLFHLMQILARFYILQNFDYALFPADFTFGQSSNIMKMFIIYCRVSYGRGA